MNDRGRWMQCASGKPYWPSDPHPSDVRVEDIAWHLSMLCRFTGACKRFYSVAEHSVHVSRLVPQEGRLPLLALLHDAPEAYLNDINKPVKVDPDMSGYRYLEGKNWRAISIKFFGHETELPEEVHRADQAMYWAERRALMPRFPRGVLRDMYPVQRSPQVKVLALPPEGARKLFMNRYKELTR